MVKAVDDLGKNSRCVMPCSHALFLLSESNYIDSILCSRSAKDKFHVIQENLEVLCHKILKQNEIALMLGLMPLGKKKPLLFYFEEDNINIELMVFDQSLLTVLFDRI